jgi:hypothetical protein
MGVRGWHSGVSLLGSWTAAVPSSCEPFRERRRVRVEAPRLIIAHVLHVIGRGFQNGLHPGPPPLPEMATEEGDKQSPGRCLG